MAVLLPPIIQLITVFSFFKGRSVGPTVRIALIANLDMLKLYYRFQTFHDDSCVIFNMNSLMFLKTICTIQISKSLEF